MDKKWDGKRFVPSVQETWRGQTLISKTCGVHDTKIGFDVPPTELPTKAPMLTYQDAEAMADNMNAIIENKTNALEARAEAYVKENYPKFWLPGQLVELYIGAINNEKSLSI